MHDAYQAVEARRTIAVSVAQHHRQTWRTPDGAELEDVLESSDLRARHRALETLLRFLQLARLTGDLAALRFFLRHFPVDAEHGIRAAAFAAHDTSVHLDVARRA